MRGWPWWAKNVKVDATQEHRQTLLTAVSRDLKCTGLCSRKLETVTKHCFSHHCVTARQWKDNKCICYFPTGIQDFILLLIKAVSMTRRNFTRQVLFLLHFSFCLTHSFLAGHSEVTNSIVWLPGQINCLVAGMQSRFLKIFDIRGQSYSCTFTPVLVFMPSSPQTAM